jgi:ribosomal protein S18 acetylase RimI-like enzyme
MSKVLMVANCAGIGMADQVSPCTSVSVESLANLMVDAYRGTVDWEDGDDEDVAEAEIRATLNGKYGSFLSTASGVIVDQVGKPISALFVSDIGGLPTILFVYTSKNVAGRGMASKLIRNAGYRLNEMGFQEVSLFVSEDNPARALYEKLGFTEK